MKQICLILLCLLILDISSGFASEEEAYGGWWISNYGILTAKESQYIT
ncbi:secreted protein, partial [Candidatus Magnetomorum sp. HK-1]